MSGLWGAVLFMVFNLAQAFETQPEFRGLAAEEAQSLSDPHDVDAEYNSDYIAYQKSLKAEADLYRRGRGLSFNVGSLGGKEFLIDQELILKGQLKNGVILRVLILNDQNFEDDFSVQKMELSYLSPRGWGISGMGTLAFQKEENDVGVALMKRQGLRETKIFLSFLDFQRNLRNRESDRWARHQEPRAYGIVHRSADEGGGERPIWHEFSLRHEPRSAWIFPDEARRYEHHRVAGYLKLLRQVQVGQNESFRLSYDDKFESERYSQPAPDGEAQVRLRRWWAHYEREFVLNSYKVRLGLHHFWRQYRNLGQEVVVYRDWLPTAWLDLGNSNWGYDLSLRSMDQSDAWVDAESFEAHHRLNYVYRLEFENESELSFLLSFDLDRFGTGETWEGGAVKMNFYF